MVAWLNSPNWGETKLKKNVVLGDLRAQNCRQQGSGLTLSWRSLGFFRNKHETRCPAAVTALRAVRLAIDSLALSFSNCLLAEIVAKYCVFRQQSGTLLIVKDE